MQNFFYNWNEKKEKNKTKKLIQNDNNNKYTTTNDFMETIQKENRNKIKTQTNMEIQKKP